jgi:hypothetical protein
MLFWLFAIAVLLPFTLLAFLVTARVCEGVVKLLLPGRKATIDKILTPLYAPILPLAKGCLYALLGLMVIYFICLFLGLLPPTRPDR